MVVLSYLGISIVVGVLSGLVWRLIEDRWERRAARLARQVEEETDVSLADAPADKAAN